MKIEKEFLIFKRLLGRNRARPICTVHARLVAAWLTRIHAAYPARTDGLLALPMSQPGAVPIWRSGAHRARGDGGARTQSGLHGTVGGERLRHEPHQGLHPKHPRRTANLPDMVESSNSKQGKQAMEGAELNGGEGVT
jgi:hypothetical protein